MVKRQKEKQYQSAKEQRVNSQLRAGGGHLGSQERRLPFSCCALTLAPFSHPVCTTNGIVFENTALLPFLLKHKVDPVTGKPMTSRDVITLHMDRDEEGGEWQCPIMTKHFSDHTKIVAIRHGNNANVYSWQAYYELNIKTKNTEDLISGEKFTKKDVIILNDPENADFNKLRDINNFHHVLHARLLEGGKSSSSNVQHSITATRVLDKLSKRPASSSSFTSTTLESSSKKPKITSDMVLSGKSLTSGATSGSLTSSSMAISNSSDSREATQDEILSSQFALMRKLRKKGYVTLQTNMGDIGLELHCDIAPRTCTNFLGLADAGKYNGSTFHRLIPTFMIQGGKGDPDESLWGEPFVDEFDDRLQHDMEGVLSMANAGPKTNKRQFFLTLGEAPHLNRKHSIFGRVVEGNQVLHEMKKVPTDKKDRPVHEIVITGIQILVNPAKEAEEMEKTRIEKLLNERARTLASRHASSVGKQNNITSKAQEPSLADPKSFTPTVGKYLLKTSLSTKYSSKDENDVKLSAKASRLPPPPKKTGFGDFGGW